MHRRFRNIKVLKNITKQQYVKKRKSGKDLARDSYKMYKTFDEFKCSFELAFLACGYPFV